MIHILLVDDDSEYVSMIKHHLHSFQNKQFQVTWVNEGEKVIQTLKSNPGIDVVLMDYYLPKTNGVEVSKHIFQEKIGVPVILLTSNKDFRIAVEAMKYGVEDYLVKEELGDTMLARTIISVLEGHQLKKQIASAERDKLITQKTSEAVQELVVTMCHEFNNPLAAIKISADILLRQSIDEEDKKLLNNLNSNISHLEKQIIKLRDLNAGK